MSILSRTATIPSMSASHFGACAFAIGWKLLTPSHAFPRLLAPSHAFHRLLRCALATGSLSRPRRCLPTLSATCPPSRQCDMAVALSTATSLTYACMHACMSPCPCPCPCTSHVSPCISPCITHLLRMHTCMSPPCPCPCPMSMYLLVSACLSFYHTSPHCSAGPRGWRCRGRHLLSILQGQHGARANER